ncbi:TetR/AcrR family transcriptional regulator [Streptomyces sp. NPDC126514]|uniref:TetR/AcrR family transcriptional regulator n=1 Tax=Streptomyces sp. NPDC126514 TaxID=3155210 RepID=UPI0033347C64
MTRATTDLVARAVQRPLAERYEASATEVRRLMDAALTVIEHTGDLDPTVRAILTTAGLSNQAFYRHFCSKDDLIAALLEDGRHQLAGYLRHRMAQAPNPQAAVREWVAGILAQAADPRVAARTRPFLAHADRLASRLPGERRASEQAVIDPLAEALSRMQDTGTTQADGLCTHACDARTVYLLTMAILHDHLREGTHPGPQDTEHLIAFIFGGLSRGRAVPAQPAAAPPDA